MIFLVSSFLIYVNLCAREDACARVFRTSAAPSNQNPFIQNQQISKGNYFGHNPLTVIFQLWFQQCIQIKHDAEFDSLSEPINTLDTTVI